MSLLTAIPNLLFGWVFALSGTQWVLIILGLLIFTYYMMTKEYGKYEAHGVFTLKPIPFFGNQMDLVLGRVGPMDFHRDLWKKYEGHKYTIYYEGSQPMLYPRDPELLKAIMIKDFDHFMDFTFFPDAVNHLEGNNLGLGNTFGEEWKSLKYSISPAFSLKNMKNMAMMINETAMDFVDELSKKANTNFMFEDLVGKYTMDCIGKTVFSIKLNSMRTEKNEFVDMGNALMDPMRFLFTTLFPWVAWALNMPSFSPKSVQFFMKVTKDIVAQRDNMSNPPQDVLGLMLKVRDNELTDLHSEDFGLGQVSHKNYMTTDMIARTLTQFFLDGYDTVSSTIILCLYHLAMNPSVQDRAFEEVEELADRTGGKITGEDVNEMKYLDNVISETARVSPFPFSNRKCTKDWIIPGTNIPIPKGMRVIIPIAGIQMDPKYHPDPETFNPDRYSPENKAKIAQGTYIPFGMGPRQCIGMKIARLEAKVLMFQTLRKFRIELCSQSKVPIVWRKDHFNRIEGGAILKFVPRD